MTLIQSLSAIFLIIFLGVICHKRKILNHVQVEGLEISLFKILTPCYLFSSIIKYDIKALINLPFIYSYLLSFIFIAILTSFIFYKNNSNILLIRVCAAGYVNTAIYALPIITFLFGNPVAAIISNLLEVIVIQSIFITVISLSTSKQKSITARLLALISTPLIVMPVLGLLCNYMQIAINSIIMQATHTLGN